MTGQELNLEVGSILPRGRLWPADSPTQWHSPCTCWRAGMSLTEINSGYRKKNVEEAAIKLVTCLCKIKGFIPPWGGTKIHPNKHLMPGFPASVAWGEMDFIQTCAECISQIVSAGWLNICDTRMAFSNVMRFHGAVKCRCKMENPHWKHSPAVFVGYCDKRNKSFICSNQHIKFYCSFMCCVGSCIELILV